MVSETLGFATVVINLYRPETDEYEVTNVHGNERARAILLGHVTHASTWSPMLDPRFLRRGAFFIPAGAVEWDEDITWYTPDLRAQRRRRRRGVARRRRAVRARSMAPGAGTTG